jgi:DNA-binding NtrC family response regulator
MNKHMPRGKIGQHHTHSERQPSAETEGTKQETKFRILIIDDEVDLRAFLLEFCELNGYEAECAANGRAALERLEKARFNLAIVDYLMPEIHGVEFVKRAKERCPDLAVIAMSAWYDMEPAFLEAGAFKFMKKPFDPYQLEEELAVLARIGAK